MNRAWQVKQTLRHNVESCADHELILVNYGSTDDLDEWVRSEFSDDIRAGKLIYFATSEPIRFHASKSKNLAHRLATGDIVLNCDGDNFVTARDLRRIAAVFAYRPNVVLQNFSGNPLDGSFGRIALRRSDFDRLGGYDEGLLPIGAQDVDLIARAVQMGLGLVRMGVLDRLPVPNTLADKTPLGSGLEYPAINSTNLAYCYNRQKIMGPIRETQSPAWRGHLNLSSDPIEVRQPVADSAPVTTFATHPARDPGALIQAFSGFRMHLRRPGAVTSETWLRVLHDHWGGARSVAPDSLLTIHEAALSCKGPILECGSGLTSLILAASSRHGVTALESDALRYRNMHFVKQLVGLPNLRLVHSPIRSYPDYDWYDFTPEPPQQFSMVVCDGPLASLRGGRAGLAPQMKSFLAPDFTIFLDDAEHVSEREALSTWARALGKLSVRIDPSRATKALAMITPG